MPVIFQSLTDRLGQRMGTSIRGKIQGPLRHLRGPMIIIRGGIGYGEREFAGNISPLAQLRCSLGVQDGLLRIADPRMRMGGQQPGQVVPGNHGLRCQVDCRRTDRPSFVSLDTLGNFSLRSLVL